MVTIKIKIQTKHSRGSSGTVGYHVTHKRTTRIIDTGYHVSQKEIPKLIRLTKIGKTNGIRISYETGEAVTDQNSEYVIDEGRKEELRSICEKIRHDIDTLKHIIKSFAEENFTADKIVSTFASQRHENTFSTFMNQIIDRLASLKKWGTANNYRYTLNSFMLFMRYQPITISEISSELIEDYEVWLKEKGISPNSSSFYLRNLRAVYNRAVVQTLVQDRQPFRKVYTGISKTTKRAITWNEIKKIKNLNLKPELSFARDIFLFQFYSMGMAFVDLVFLKRENIQNGLIVYRRRKTTQEIKVPINNYLNTLIKKYENPSSPYIMPILGSTDENEHKTYLSRLHRINPQLKKIGRMAGLAMNLTTYVSRHSWASIAKEKGIDIVTISEALGHDNIKTTEIYLSSINITRLARANEIILKGL